MLCNFKLNFSEKETWNMVLIGLNSTDRFLRKQALSLLKQLLNVL